jgi:DNA-binding transcriptional LysR family regulator
VAPLVPGLRERADQVVADRGDAEAAVPDVGGQLLAVLRIVDPGPPVTVAYALTPRGQALIPALEQVAAWAREHLPDS